MGQLEQRGALSVSSAQAAGDAALVLERVSDAFVALDKSWRYTFVNQHAARIFGRKPEDLIGKHIWTEFPEGVGQPFYHAYHRAMATQQFTFLEDYYPPYDRWFENRIFPSSDGLSIFFHDITDRKRAEALLVGQNRVLEATATGDTLADSLNALVRMVESQRPAMRASILLLDPDGLHLRHGAAPSLPQSYMQAIDGSPIGPKAGSCGTAAYRREAVVVADIESDPLWADYRELARPLGLRACWSTPIFDPERRLLGTFAMYYGEITTPSDWDRKIIDVATHLAAIAITRDRTETALKRSECRYRALVDSNVIGVIIADTAGMIREANDEFLRILGYSREELRAGLRWDTLTPEEFRELDAYNLMQIAETGSCPTCEKEFFHKDGHRVPIRITTAMLDGSASSESICLIEDITARKRSEQQLRESESRLAEAQAYVGLGSWEMVPGSNKVHWSDEIFRLHGLAPGTTMPSFEGFLELVHPEDRALFAEHFRASMDQGLERSVEYRTDPARGPIRYLSAAGHALRNSAGEVVRLFGTVLDVTARKEQELIRYRNAELEERNRMALEATRLKSEFIASMSHELRTPLNAIIGFSEFLSDEKPGPLNPRQREYLSDVLSSGRHLLQLINDVLDLAKVEAGKLELHPTTFSLREAVDEVCSVVAPLTDKKRLTLRVEHAPEIDQVTLDAQRLKQVLLNLVGNAVKFTDSGGRIGLVTRPFGTDRVEIRVSDTGIGIRREDFGRLFAEFQQLDSGSGRRHEGTGLGLALSKRIVESMQGIIGLESEFGKGSTFLVVLPRKMPGSE